MRRGFTLVEMVLVLTMVAILAAISVNEFSVQVMRAKRTEAVVALDALWAAQQVHYMETGHYSATFPPLSFEVSGWEYLSPTVYKGGRYTYQLSQPWGPTSFYCIATAQLDSDPWPDILEVYEFGE